MLEDSRTGIEHPIFIPRYCYKDQHLKIMISILTQISVIQAIVYFIAAAVPIYLYFIQKKYHNRNKDFRDLIMVPAAFVIIQGIYHSAGALGFSLFAKGILEPLSLAVLLFFGVIYLVNRLKAKEEDVKEVQ